MLRQRSLFAPVNTVLIIINLVVLNLVAVRVFGRVDLTENKVYTLSPVTKQILRNLGETLTIKAYFTRDLPAPYNNIARFVQDQLSEMKAYSRGHLRYEFLDPATEEELKKEAERFRLEPLQVNEVRADKMEIKLAYMGMVLIYEDRQEVIPAVQTPENLEYEVVSKIKLVTSKETRQVGFVEGHGEPTLRDNLGALDRELRKIYTVKPVDLGMRSSIPDDIGVLCLIGPTADLPEKDRFAIDQFIMRGGKLFFAANNVESDIQAMHATKSQLRIDNWTETYGFRFNTDLVVDRMAPTLPFQTVTRFGRQITYVIYPLFPEIINFNRDLIALKVLRQVRFYYPSSIDTTPAANLDSVKLVPLAWSSERAGVMNPPFDINPLTLRGKITLDRSNIPMAVMLQGKFTSYFKNRPIPVDSTGAPITDEEVIPMSPDTRMVVLSDAHFIQDQYLVPGLDNLTMVLNLIDWLAQDEALISIRSKEVTGRPIKADVSDAVRKGVKYANMTIPPLLVIGFGIARWRVRKAARRMALQDISTGLKTGRN